MIRPAIVALASTVSLSACAARAEAAPPSVTFLAAHLLGDEAVVTSTSKRFPIAAKARVERSTFRHGVPGPSISRRVDAAQLAAIQEPDPDAYMGAMQVYPWAEGALYQLYTTPGQVSDIALQVGESLISVAAGDTARWVIGDTASGTGPTRRTHVLVKPSAVGLRTNLVIATDRRVYHVELESTARTGMASIAWAYAEDPLVALRAQQAAEATVAPGVAVEALNFNYRIEGDRPPWRPVRAFDDGHQLFIEFPPSLADGEAPPLFVTGEGGRAELVNYRVSGHYYVVDRLFAAAELRLGERRQQVVRIVREDASHRRGS